MVTGFGLQLLRYDPGMSQQCPEADETSAHLNFSKATRLGSHRLEPRLSDSCYQIPFFL